MRGRARAGRQRSWRFVLGCAVGGFALGVIARIWMRWISVHPEFSWAGTGAIVASFTVFAAAQSTAAVTRSKAAGPGTIAAVRALSALLSIGLFGAAGSVMLPTVLFGSLAVWRSDFPRVVRLALSLLALPSVVFVLREIVDDHDWSVETIGRMLLFLAIYAAVIVAIRPTVEPIRDGWRPSRRAVVVVAVSVAALLGVALYVGGVQ